MMMSKEKRIFEPLKKEDMHYYKPPTALEIVDMFKDSLTEEEYKNLKEYFEHNTLKSRMEEFQEQLDMYNKHAEHPLTPAECYSLDVKKPHWNDEIDEDDEQEESN